MSYLHLFIWERGGTLHLFYFPGGMSRLSFSQKQMKCNVLPCHVAQVFFLFKPSTLVQLISYHETRKLRPQLFLLWALLLSLLMVHTHGFLAVPQEKCDALKVFKVNVVLSGMFFIPAPSQHETHPNVQSYSSSNTYSHN